MRALPDEFEGGSGINGELPVFGKRTGYGGRHRRVGRDVKTRNDIGESLDADMQGRNQIDPHFMPPYAVFDFLRACGLRSILRTKFSAEFARSSGWPSGMLRVVRARLAKVNCWPAASSS